MSSNPPRIILSAQAVDALRSYAQPAGKRERGGLLLGWWGDAEITVQMAVEVLDPEASFASWTRREIAAQRALDKARVDSADPRIGYVGDWHTHPLVIGASEADEASLRRVSCQYGQPIVLVIVLPDGGFDIRSAQGGKHLPRESVIEYLEEQT